MSETIWDVLDIAPTADTTAIRRAYADRYRQSEDELDAGGLARLRGARDAALDQATRWTAMEMAPPPGDEDGAFADSMTADRDTETLPADDDAPATTDYDGHFQALWLLLFEDHDFDVEDDDGLRQAFEHHFTIVLSDPRMSEIEHFAQVEQWFAALLAQTSPRSDAVLALAADHFKWMDQAGDVAQAPAIAFVTSRRKLLGFFEDIRNPKHRLHPAWRELTTPATENSRRGWFVGKKKVHELLSLVRRDYPPLEQHFDWYRVSMWENPAGWAISGGALIFLGLILLQFVRIASTMDAPSPNDSRPAESFRLMSQLSEPRADIREALKGVSDGMIDADDIETRNPELYSSLRMAWDDASANGRDKWQLRNDMIDSLNARFRRIVVKANHADLSDLVENRLAQAKFFRQLGDTYCDRFFKGTLGSSVKPPLALLDEDRKIRFRILADTRGEAPERAESESYMIPGKVLDDSAKRLGMTYDQFVKAMHDDGSPKRGCDTEVALRETALRLPPKEGVKLLRHM